MRLIPFLTFRRLWSTLGLAALFFVVSTAVEAQPTPSPARPGATSTMPMPTPAPGNSRIMNGPIPTPAGDGTPMIVRPPTSQADSGPNSPPSMGDNSSTMVGPLKFGDLTVDAALELLEQWTGRIVLRPQALPATSLVLSIPRSVPKTEAIQALETVLALNLIAVAPMGDKFLKVTPLAQIRSEAPELIEGTTLNLPSSGRVAAKLFEFQYMTASEFVPQLATLLSPGIGAAPVVVDKANAALITDTVSNLQRIERLIAQLDHPSLTKLTPHFYSLTNAKASDVANSIRTLIGGSLAPQIGTSVTVQPDDRTNQIIILCDARQKPFFDELVEKLNSKGETNTRQDVIFLKHAVSKDVAILLTNLVAGKKQANTTGTGQQGQAQTAAQLAAAAAARRNVPATNPATPGTGATPPANVAAAIQAAVGDSITEFSSLLTIISEDRSNSLVVSGTVDDIAIIRELVNKIDILLAQVRIEMLICEVSLDDDHTSGISALGLQLTGGKLVGFNTSIAGATVGGAADGSGFATFAANHDLSAIIGLSTTPRKNNLSILSSPTIVATHNQESTIFVGESDPVLSSYTNTGTTVSNGNGSIGTGYNTAVTYKDIGIQVKVKPLIGNDGALELQISTEVNDILKEILVDGNQQPVIAKRTTDSFVSVRDGEILVLGGLQKRTLASSTNRLGPIPIIGDLLGGRTKQNDRDDLVFFLRPYLLTNTSADNDSTLKRLDGLKQGTKVRAILENGEPVTK